ncbi:MAG: SPOR domain-containing protein [Proteobacteria bacterium]|nr:SPOR domain-containing protein [Pseudomonadota bacterium]
MSDYDRGAYTPPTDEPLSFDARSPQRRRPMPTTLIASVVVLAVLVGALFVFYQSGVRGANEPPRAVGKSMASIKTAPPVEDAKPVSDQPLDVYVTDKNAPSAQTPNFAPDPEQPQQRVAARPVVVEPTAPRAAPTQPVQVAAAPPIAPPPVKVAQAAAPKAAPLKTAAADAALRPVKATPAPAKVAAAKTPDAAVSAGSAMVQIGAFSSPTIADQEFSKVRASFARFASGHAKRVEPVEKGGHTLYRTAFTGYSKPAADAFCAALTAAGRSCIVK